MSLYNRDETFIFALKKQRQQRSEKDLNVIFSRLHRFEALSNVKEQNLKALCSRVRYEAHDTGHVLYKKDDLCSCWYILLSGSIFIQGAMFLRNTSFGKQVPGSKHRQCECLVLEPSEMIAIDYPDLHPSLHTASVRGASRNHSTSSRSTLDSVVEVDSRSSSAESSPSQSVSRKTGQKMANGQALALQSDPNCDIIKDPQQYYAYQDDAISHDDPEQEEQQSDEEQEDSISLHSSSSLVKDLVTEVLRKHIDDRNEDDHDVLLEFTRSLRSFSNMTEPIRRELCKVMVFAEVAESGTELLKDNEELDSWSVIINGEVQHILPSGEKTTLYMGESFGVTPSNQTQYHKGTLLTLSDECQFLCVAHTNYCKVLRQGQENMENVYGEDGNLEMVKEKREIEGGKKGLIVIRGTPGCLRQHLLEENSIDTTYAEDFLLTYRAFFNEPQTICSNLLEWFDKEDYKTKVTRIILLWVNNHFNDFECSRHMMDLLEKFEEKLQKCNKTGEWQLFNIACSTKAKSRVIQLSRASNEEDLCFTITGGTDGYPIFILKVMSGSVAEEKGLKRGDQLLNVNGQNFEKLNMEKANTILRKNTELTLTVKTNLFSFKEMMTDLKNPHRKKEKKHAKKEDVPVIAQISTLQPGGRVARMPSTVSEMEYDQKTKKEAPEDVIKVFRADQTHRFVFVNQDTTAEEAVRSACKEFGIVDHIKNYSLCRVTVQNESFVKQSKLPDKLSNLSEIPLSARYYLKNNMESEQLLPDENIPELLKEANYSFLDLNCFEVALHLTIQDYELFKTVEQTDFIDDLFQLNVQNLAKFKEFEDLVNRELFWVVTTMCSEPNVLRRAKMIKNFTKIAHHCKVLKNLNSAFAIISGLGYRAVTRMKSAWDKVPARSQRTFEDLQSLMDPSRNMSKYRTLLGEMINQPPVIPYIPVVKKDLTFLDLGNDTKVEQLINFEKMRMIGREVRNVCRLCTADSSQVIPGALASQHESDRPSSNLYHTLTRRGRRSSFNNAKKMYEDAVNARRVKQYMQQLKIETDEDKLLELSKKVEPLAPNSTQPKRRNAQGTNDSPSRSSKTLPGPRSNVIHARNNSEPQIMTGHGLSLQPTRKKNPISSFPKFGTTSPQAIRKLLALSEESGDGGSSSSSKHGSLEQRRNGSTSSRELSPTTSPYLSPKHDIARSKGSLSSNDSAHSIGHENTNRNNNRGKQGDRAVIMQGRSGSFGALSVTTISSDRRPHSAVPERRNLGSSSPSLAARAASSHHHLILPNHPQIPRSPSMDSGVVSMGSLSADSTRFLGSDPGEIFTRNAHQSNSSLSSVEGYHSQQSLHHMSNQGTHSGHHQSPVVRRHVHNLHTKDKMTKTKSMDVGESGPAPQNMAPSRKSMPPRAPGEGNPSKTHDDKEDDIKQTFLSGSRGYGDAPLKRDKDPWPTAAKLPPGTPRTPTEPMGWPSVLPGDSMATVGLHTHVPANGTTEYHSHIHSQKSGEFKGGGDVIDGPYHRKGVIAGSGPEIQQYYDRLRAQEHSIPPSTLKFRQNSPSRGPELKTPEEMLEERYKHDYQQQKSRLNKSFDSSCLAMVPGGKYHLAAPPLCERHSMSYSAMPGQFYEDPGTHPATNFPLMHQLNMGKSDPSLRHNTSLPVEYPNYPYPGNGCNKPGCKCPGSRSAHPPMRQYKDYNQAGPPPPFNFTQHARTSSPKQHGENRGPLSLPTEPDNVFISDFGKPNPRTFVRTSALQEHREKQESLRSEAPLSSPLHCSKQGTPNLHQPLDLPYSGMQGGLNSALSSLRNPPDTPSLHARVSPRIGGYDPTSPYTSSPNEVHPNVRFLHTRSTSDVSLNSSDLFSSPDNMTFFNPGNKLTGMQYQGIMNNVPGYPSPIDGYPDPPHPKTMYYRDTPSNSPSPAGTPRLHMGNVSISSTPKSHPPAVRRKSSEWGVTDLDSQQQKQTMQVWSGSSGLSKNSSTPTAPNKDNSSPSKKNDSQCTEPSSQPNVTPKRKKPPPPLPPQRTSSFAKSRARLSSGTLSPLSTPPTSPTTPISMSKLTLSESHPQLVVKTRSESMLPMVSPTMNSRSSESSGPIGNNNPPTKPNGVLPHYPPNPAPPKDSSSQEQAPGGRTLPSYTQAVSHLSSQSKAQLPTYQNHYQNHQDPRESPEQISQV